MEKLLTREEVGERLGISPRTVARLVARGELPVVRIGRLARYRGTDVTALIEASLEVRASPSLSEEELEKRLREEARRYEHDLRELAKT